VATYRAAPAKRTRDLVPLDWAMSTGNQGVALMMIASEPTKARTAVEQIDVAMVTMRDGWEAPRTTKHNCQRLKLSLIDMSSGDAGLICNPAHNDARE
jgi:hypothetical protein